MAADPITINQNGDRKKRLADHVVLIAGLDPDGVPVPFNTGGVAGAGDASAANQATQIATLGATNGAAVTTDANGTLQQYLRGLVKMAAAGTINVRVKNGASFDIPAFNYQVFTYVGSTNNVATQVFKSGGSGGTTVATLTYAYVASGAADDDKILSITQS